MLLTITGVYPIKSYIFHYFLFFILSINVVSSKFACWPVNEPKYLCEYYVFKNSESDAACIINSFPFSFTGNFSP